MQRNSILPITALCLVFLGALGSSQQERLVVHAPSRNGQSAPTSQACLDAAKAKLGPSAVVLQCGNLGDGGLDVLSVLSLKTVCAHKGCIPVSRLVILRQEKAGWQTALEAGPANKNPAGYIATDYIDDGGQFFGYCVELGDTRSDGFPAFAVSLTDINPNDQAEGASTEISWNDKVHRYQEFVTVDGFKPEVKNPPHINTHKGCCGQPKNATATPPKKP